MNCSNCGEPIETGASFCGNCGHPILQQLQPAPASSAPPQTQATPPQPPPVAPASTTISQVYANQAAASAVPVGFVPVASSSGLPAYAVPVLDRQSGELKAAMSLVVGILGMVATIFIPLIGIILAVAGIVLATMSRQSAKRGMSTFGLIISSLALLAGLASWAYVISHDSKTDHKVAASSAPTSPIATDTPISAEQGISTPCYKVNFDGTYNVQNNSGSCNMNAFNGTTLNSSTIAYKVYATAATVSASNFDNLAKAAIERDVASSLPDFKIYSESAGVFAGSPAYIVQAENAQGIKVEEAAVLHATSNGDNFFVFVHAVVSGSVGLNLLEKSWSWK